MNEILPLFAKPVYVSTPAFVVNQYKEVIEYCKNSEYYINVGQNFASDRRDVLLDPVFKDINELIHTAIDHYVKKIMMWTSNEFYVTQSWINVNPQNTEHHIHYHVNSILSGTFYLQTNEYDNIIFYNKSEQAMLQIERSSFNIWNSDYWKVPVTDNTIIIFPSSLSHSVAKNECDNNRISIAFNIFARGEFGSVENLTYLKL